MSGSDTENYDELRAKRIAERKNLFAELFEDLKKDKENVVPSPKEKNRKNNKKQQASNDDSPFRVEVVEQGLEGKRYNTRERTKKPIIETDSESDTSTSQKKISNKKKTTKKSDKKTGKQVLARQDDDPDFTLYNKQLNFKRQYNTRSKKQEMTE